MAGDSRAVSGQLIPEQAREDHAPRMEKTAISVIESVSVRLQSMIAKGMKAVLNATAEGPVPVEVDARIARVGEKVARPKPSKLVLTTGL